ncbi:YhcH/YjgK/YiaL family protein [Granulicatella balaenopterae]|uniref:YhcH/YjgK/YiaL family protein n=1 Tax=Granulicatella balaenopterae TaxID=137733 RepID=A0A1H9L076_9LACT|nr:YhcH/YjgK/YiaL family protein [Granulicatella balaenopterae]SER04547.1 YhcH/YjgK/YiaL family protein [Granulicatella balaenopterae]
MLFDNIKYSENYKSSPIIYRVLNELKKINLENFPESSIVYEQDKLFANPVTLTSKPEKDCIYESHKKFLDVHYILEGVEGIATAHPDALFVKDAYQEDKDIAFYTGNENGRYYLEPGDFLICWPSDAHKVAMMKDQPTHIKKIVVKISVDLV